MAGIIGYLRVSTKGQGESGLGLEAQKAAIETYARQDRSGILTYYTEVESGKLANRPELARALSHCRRSKATLVVAKLDRLARNVAFLSTLMDSTVPFVACDNPHANRLTLHILAAVAEAEAKAISDRTKAALAAYRARGGKLGGSLPHCRNLTPQAIAKGQKMGAEAARKAAAEAYADLAPRIRELRSEGLTLQAIAEKLNLEGHTTRRGRPWSPVQVSRILDRMKVTTALIVVAACT
jgi:DNA invertase Pin-like site-specific DNA recombinase